MTYISFRFDFLLRHQFINCIYSRIDYPLRPIPEEDDHPYLLLAQWAPKGHGLIMVKDYDIYYKKTPSSHSGFRITNTAIPGVISHGVPDWLYEGEYKQ